MLVSWLIREDSGQLQPRGAPLVLRPAGRGDATGGAWRSQRARRPARAAASAALASAWMGEDSSHRVVIVGGGFGGLQAALKLRRAPVELTLVDRRNFHLFQPLTYQVATGALSPGEIAYPLRSILKARGSVRVLMAEVADFDLDERELRLRAVDGVPAPDSIPYDSLIVAGGSHYSYFGHDEWDA